jgi:hypothetical protein
MGHREKEIGYKSWGDEIGLGGMEIRFENRWGHNHTTDYQLHKKDSGKYTHKCHASGCNILTFLYFCSPDSEMGCGVLSDGVMVTQQILVLSFKVRALVGQL